MRFFQSEAQQLLDEANEMANEARSLAAQVGMGDFFPIGFPVPQAFGLSSSIPTVFQALPFTPVKAASRTCLYCTSNYADKEPRCPNCGAPK